MIEARNCVFGFECRAVWALLKETPDITFAIAKSAKRMFILS